MEAFTAIVVFLSGAIIGSFLNVCIYRLPRAGYSLLTPPFSCCPVCGSAIKFGDNIPIVSYILLRGKCRSCRACIPFQYPLVEALSGALALAIFFKFGISPAAVWFFLFLSTLSIIAFIDLEHMLIPDALSLGGTFVALVLSPLILGLSFFSSALGAIAGGGFTVIVDYAYKKAAGRDGFGFGDAKLLAFVGAAMGWQSLLAIIFLSSFLGSLFGVFLLLIHGKNGLRREIPFALFVASASALYLLGKDFFIGLFQFWTGFF